jgi:hypothetical protein
MFETRSVQAGHLRPAEQSASRSQLACNQLSTYKHRHTTNNQPSTMSE